MSKQTFANPSKFLWTLRSTDRKMNSSRQLARYHSRWRSWRATKSTGWPRQRCTKTPRVRQLAEEKETKKNPELVPARLGAVFQSSYILDVVGTFWIWRQQTCLDQLTRIDHCCRCWARHAPLTLFDCVTRSCAIFSRSLDATSQRGLWRWCNGKAIEALAGRRPTARWLCLRKLVFVRLPLLP